MPDDSGSAPRPQAPALESAPAPTPLAARRTNPVRMILFALVPVALVIGAYAYVTGGAVMTSDNAYIESDKLTLASDISGIVRDVAVRENQEVAAGQVLYRLDELPFRLALDQAEAQLGIVRNDLAALQANWRDMQEQILQAQNDITYYDREFRRQSTLAATSVASQSTLDAARRNLQSVLQKAASLTQQSAAITATLNGDPAAPVERHPRYLNAVALRDEAARQLSHTVMKAPFAGIVTGLSAISPGRYLAAGTAAFYLVATDHLRVDANPKETELTFVHPGQSATITVDTYPDVEWHGTVESISPAAAQEFSLLPAQNTSGNWVKVVQRIPLRVRIDSTDPNLPRLRAGMSAVVHIETGHTNGLPSFLRGLFGRS
jgi:membrane fusion protein (multidrug efflux system)